MSALALTAIDALPEEHRNPELYWLDCTFLIDQPGAMPLQAIVPVHMSLLPVSASRGPYDQILDAVREGLWESMKLAIRQGHEFSLEQAGMLQQRPLSFHDGQAPIERLTEGMFQPFTLPSGDTASVGVFFVRYAPTI